MLFINPIYLIISVAFSSSVTPCLNAIFCPLIVVLLIAKHKIRPKRALSLLSLYTLLDNVFCFHFSSWSWGFFLLNRILWILRLFFLFFNNSFCRFMDAQDGIIFTYYPDDYRYFTVSQFLRSMFSSDCLFGSVILTPFLQDSGTKKCLPGTFIDSKVPNRHCCLTISCS